MIGSKGDFMRYSYLYPNIFESRTLTLFDSTCPELYAQQSWEWSDPYSWRNDLWKVKPARFLMVIWSGFLAPTRAFSKGGTHHFPKAHALRYGHRKFGNDRMYIRGEWALRKWQSIKFQWYRLGCQGWFQMDFGPQPVHFRKEPSNIFRKHIPWGIGTEKLGMIGCIFAENGPLKGGIESSFNGTGWGAKGDFRWILGPKPCIFGRRPPPFSKAHALRYGHRKFGSDLMYIRGEWALRKWHWIKFQWYRLGC